MLKDFGLLFAIRTLDMQQYAQRADQEPETLHHIDKLLRWPLELSDSQKITARFDVIPERWTVRSVLRENRPNCWHQNVWCMRRSR